MASRAQLVVLSSHSRPEKGYIYSVNFKGEVFCKLLLHYTASVHITVEPLNVGQVGISTDVHYSEVVLYWGVFVKNNIS